ncbi:hypothetical protein CR513_34010, partial [Mucuna pruriens]
MSKLSCKGEMSSICDQDNFSISNTTEHVFFTPPIVTGSTNVRPSRHEGQKSHLDAYNHFIQLELTLDKKDKCKYCDVIILYENGTSSMHAYVLRCKNNPNEEGNKRQKIASSSTTYGWNSTYLILDATLKHKKAFEELEFHDMKYVDELAKGKENELKSRLEYSLKLLFDEYNGHKKGTQNDTQQAHEEFEAMECKLSFSCKASATASQSSRHPSPTSSSLRSPEKQVLILLLLL